MDAQLATLSTGATLPVQVCDLCVDILGASGGYVAIASPGHSDIAVHAGDDDGSRLAALEVELGEGPAHSAMRTHEPAVVTLGRQSVRWPVFVEAASRVGPVRVHAFPLRSAVGVFGVLVVHVARGQMLSVEDEVAQVLVDRAGGALLGCGDAEALVGSDDWSRSAVIHQATGMMAAQLGIGADSAFVMLRSRAFSSAQTVAQVARDVVERRLDFHED